MGDVDDHITILSASENLQTAISGMRREINKTDLKATDKVGLVIRLAQFEAIAESLDTRAQVIAETQP